jgi:hypothetical protein
VSTRARHLFPCSSISLTHQSGQGEIRTHGGHKAHTGFRDRRLQPLGHLSGGTSYAAIPERCASSWCSEVTSTRRHLRVNRARRLQSDACKMSRIGETLPLVLPLILLKTPMRLPPLKSIVALLCALALCLNTTVFAHGFVHCEGADGILRLEWGCVKDAAGHCDDACSAGSEESEDPDHHSESEPCEDAPVSSPPCAAGRGALHKQNLDLPDLSPAPILWIATVALPAPSKIGWERMARMMCSPPSLRAVRTVILLV